jgi:hypothetical protein
MGYGSKFNPNHDEQSDVEERLISLKLTRIGQCGAAFGIRNIADTGAALHRAALFLSYPQV